MSGAEYLQGFSKLIFTGAVTFLKKKSVLSKEEYDALSDRAKAKAFTVSGYTAAEVLQEFLDKLTVAVEEGRTLEDWKTQMDAWLDAHGYEGMNPGKAELIFRTNVQTAYNAGHYKSMMQAKKLRPYWMYVTAGDDRVRDTHAALHGAVYRADDSFWKVWYPPNGYKCRCHVRSYSERQIRERNLQVQTKPPITVDLATGEIKALRPDKGFASNPALDAWRPDVSKFTPIIRSAFQSRLSALSKKKGR